MSDNTKYNITVRIGLKGNAQYQLRVDADMTLVDLQQIIMNKEGNPLIEGVRFLTSKKNLDVKRNGKLLTLGQHGVGPGAVIFGAIRLLGGAQVVEGTGYDEEDDIEGDAEERQMDAKKVKALGCETLTGIGCDICCDDRSNICKAKIPGCNHKFCAQCLYGQINAGILNGTLTANNIKCPWTGCTQPIEQKLAFTAMGLNKTEWAEKEALLVKNNGLTLNITVCPNDSCQKFVFKVNSDSRVKCPSCNYGYFCFDCGKEWIGSGGLCGNQGCDKVAILFAVLQHSYHNDTKTITHSNVTIENVPMLRLCPYCYQLNEHVKRCKHMTCVKCVKTYCQSCLKPKTECPNSVKCTVAPCQEVTKEMLK